MNECEQITKRHNEIRKAQVWGVKGAPIQMILPICVDCQLEMIPLKNHFVVEIMAGERGYQKIAADKFGCPNCQIEVVSGFAHKPLAEHWMPGYGNVQAHLQVWGGPKDQATFDNVMGKDKRTANRQAMSKALAAGL